MSEAAPFLPEIVGDGAACDNAGAPLLQPAAAAALLEQPTPSLLCCRRACDAAQRRDAWSTTSNVTRSVQRRGCTMGVRSCSPDWLTTLS
jgi:hypothetical protein